MEVLFRRTVVSQVVTQGVYFFHFVTLGLNKSDVLGTLILFIVYTNLVSSGVRTSELIHLNILVCGKKTKDRNIVSTRTVRSVIKKSGQMGPRHN